MKNYRDARSNTPTRSSQFCRERGKPPSQSSLPHNVGRPHRHNRKSSKHGVGNIVTVGHNTPVLAALAEPDGSLGGMRAARPVHGHSVGPGKPHGCPALRHYRSLGRLLPANAKKEAPHLSRCSTRLRRESGCAHLCRHDMGGMWAYRGGHESMFLCGTSFFVLQSSDFEVGRASHLVK